MNGKRGIIPLCLCLSMLVLSLTACGGGVTRSGGAGSGSEAAASEGGGPPTSGWTLAEQTGAAALPEEAQAALDKATAKGKGKLEPVALLGEQVVAGMNYAILCKNTQETEDAQANLQLLTVYQDLKGNAKVTGNSPFYLVDYADEQGTAPMEEILSGGWATPETTAAATLPEPVKGVFDKAMEQRDGEAMQPAAYLASRVEDGAAVYAVLCSEKATGDPSVTVLSVVTVQEGTDGTAEVKSVCAIDPNPEMAKKEEPVNRESEEGYQDN